MTELLYFPDKEYQKGFDARVIKPREEPKVDYDGYICLDKTLFYKEGGGQPADQGTISWNGKTAEVVDVKRNTVRSDTMFRRRSFLKLIKISVEKLTGKDAITICGCTPPNTLFQRLFLICTMVRLLETRFTKTILELISNLLNSTGMMLKKSRMLLILLFGKNLRLRKRIATRTS